MNWRDYVSQEDCKLFLALEGIFTEEESMLFARKEGKDKEVARALCLSKRLIFLAYWIENE